MKHIGVIFGGQSCEHAVSIQSACSILNQLDVERYTALPIYIDHEGQWWLFPQQDTAYQASDFTDPAENATACLLTPMPGYGLRQLTDFSHIPCDVVFPIVHGSYGEDGILQGLFELADMPYVGANVAGSAVTMDKALMKSLLRSQQIPTADYVVVQQHAWQQGEVAKTALLASCESLSLPVFVKPANTGSSVGISQVKTWDYLPDAIENAFKYDRKILVEAAIAPARELEMAVIGNAQPETSLVGEVLPPDGFYDYQSKYLDDSAKLVYPAEIDAAVYAEMQTMAKATYHALGLSGMARIDFLLDQTTQQPYILEANSLPGFTKISMYPKLWSVSGTTYQALLTQLIELAEQAHASKSARQKDFSAELAKLQQSLA